MRNRSGIYEEKKTREGGKKGEREKGSKKEEDVRVGDD